MTFAARAARGCVHRTTIAASHHCRGQRSRRATITCHSFKPRKQPGSVSPTASPLRRTHAATPVSMSRRSNACVNVQKLWRINYYGARRAGGEQENLRRAQSHRESPPPSQPSGSYDSRSFRWGADTGQQDSWQPDNKAASPDPRNVRRRSVEYASRRSGGDPENQRRRLSSGQRVPPSQHQSYSSYTSDSSYSSQLPPPSGPKIDPRVQRRKPVDYASRRSGSGRSRSAPARRSSSGPVSTRQVPSKPASSPRQSNNGSTAPVVLPRQSVDYSARRTGGDPENTRRRIAASPTTSSSQDPTPSVIRRKSVDYASRRSGGQEENMRRRSQDFSIPPGSGTPPQVPVTASEALERVRQLAVRRRSVPDYAARRSNSSNNGASRRSMSPPPVPPAAPAPPSSSNGAHHSSYDNSNGTAQRAEQRATKPYIARKSVASYASRRSQDFPGRPGDPRRRRSMARFTLAEVKSALANRKQAQKTNSSGVQRTAAVDNSRNGNGARPSELQEDVDYGAHAMKSVEQLMGAYSDLAGIPVNEIKPDLSSEYRFPYNHDPAEGALKSLYKVADLVARASTSGGSRW